MPAWLFDNPVALVGAIAVIWFALRFLVAPKRGAPGLRGMFAREKPAVIEGMGRAAIGTLVEEMRCFALAEPGLRGLILAGPFAARRADQRSVVTFILVAEDPAAYADSGWLTRWGYPAQDHPVLEAVPLPPEAGRGLTIRMRGAPIVIVHAVRFDQLDPPHGLAAALMAGSETLDDPSGLAEKLRRHWVDFLNHAKGQAA